MIPASSSRARPPQGPRGTLLASCDWSISIPRRPRLTLNAALENSYPRTAHQVRNNLAARSASHDDPARVINIGSIDGLHVNKLPTFSYGPSKAGVHQLTRMLAANLASRHINVNAIAPGPFESKMMAHTLKAMGDQIIERVPRKRIGESSDMAGAAIFLSSKASSYITGIVLPVDGGITGAL